MNIELPVKMEVIRERLGVSRSYFSALKRKMGLSSARMGFVSSFSKFMRQNPQFRATDVYHSPDCGCQECMKRPVVPGGRRRGRPRRAVAVVSLPAAPAEVAAVVN